MKKENCTKGPVKISPYCPTNVCNEAQDRHIAATGHAARTPQTDEDKANAELIAEAFNVLHETGCTPQELLAQIKAIVDEIEEYGFIGVQGVDEDDENHFTGSPSFQEAKKILSHQPKNPA